VPASPDPSARGASGAPGARGRAHGHEPPDALFAALADGTRRRILRTVAEHGPVTATALAGHVPVTRQAVAKHLALLRDAGLVTAERAGRETRFTAATAPLDDLAAWAEAAGRRWDARLDRLRRRLE
jgi:DNA-binding transcriptional ArsR family regulator